MGFAAGVYLPEAKNHIPPPPYPLKHGIRDYVYTVYLFTQGREGGGGVKPERRGEGQ